MIESFRHKGLRALYVSDSRQKVPAAHAEKLRRILARMNEASTVHNIALPGFTLHPLKGDRAGTWAVSVSGNWRLTFRFENGNAYDVDLVDYH